MSWEPLAEREMLRAWALAEVTSADSPMRQIPQLDPIRATVRGRGSGLLNDADWSLLERAILSVRQPMLAPLCALHLTWHRGQLPVEALAQARTINYGPFVAKAPSRRLADLCAAEGHPGAAGGFDRTALTAAPILVGVALEGPWCLVEGYRRCCRAIRDQVAGRFDGQLLPVIVGVHPEIAEWPWWA
jgi:hypothetical protein